MDKIIYCQVEECVNNINGSCCDVDLLTIDNCRICQTFEAKQIEPYKNPDSERDIKEK